MDLDERCQKLGLTQDEFERAIQIFALLVKCRNRAIQDGVWIGSERLGNEAALGTFAEQKRVKDHLVPPSILEPN
jgi:hypothetical protein